MYESLSKDLGSGQQVVQRKQDDSAPLWFSVNRCHSYIYLPFLSFHFSLHLNTLTVHTFQTQSHIPSISAMPENFTFTIWNILMLFVYFLWFFGPVRQQECIGTLTLQHTVYTKHCQLLTTRILKKRSYVFCILQTFLKCQHHLQNSIISYICALCY